MGIKRLGKDGKGCKYLQIVFKGSEHHPDKREGKYYTEKSGRRITIEWALIRDVNDTKDTAIKLSNLLKDLHCLVNVIPLNETDDYFGKPSLEKATNYFCSILQNRGVNVTVRVRRGLDIAAGCGQLKYIEESSAKE